MNTTRFGRVALLVGLCAIGGCSEVDRSVCGDGAVTAGEECDDGDTLSGDGCSSACLRELEICTDGVDNDGDGATDCLDEDCLERPECSGTCSAPVRIDDPQVLTGNTQGRGDSARSACQESFGGGDGGDVVFEVMPRFERLHLQLMSPTDHGLSVRTTCAVANSELACSDAYAGGVDESLIVTVAQGVPVYLHVGAFSADEEGIFTLSVDGLTSQCGDGQIVEPEQCDDGNTDTGDGCDAACQFERVCGDGHVFAGDFGGDEQCDDGDTVSGDGCDESCQVEAVAEVEPNDDGTPQPGGEGTEGNDFLASGAQGPFLADSIVGAQLSPLGDEDGFEVQNSEAYDASVRLDTFNGQRGIDRPCGVDFDTVLAIRSQDGTLLALSDDRAPDSDRCGGLDVIVSAGASVFAHIVEFNDDESLGPYFLRIEFATCGDGIVEGLEECDDSNNVDGDGCTGDCVSE